uniref:Uncharacterized protein n=1 Tax=Anguilla anguilla TaxID=7936 RepID=A0A0E9W785_ANGAN
MKEKNTAFIYFHNKQLSTRTTRKMVSTIPVTLRTCVFSLYLISAGLEGLRPRCAVYTIM